MVSFIFHAVRSFQRLPCLRHLNGWVQPLFARISDFFCIGIQPQQGSRGSLCHVELLIAGVSQHRDDRIICRHHDKALGEIHHQQERVRTFHHIMEIFGFRWCHILLPESIHCRILQIFLANGISKQRHERANQQKQP